MEPTLRFRASRYVDTTVGMDGESTEDSTRTGDRGIFISEDGERRAETLRDISYKKRRIRLRPEGLDDSLAQWIPVLDDPNLNDELRATLDSISSEPNSGNKRKTYDSSVCTFLYYVIRWLTWPRITRWRSSQPSNRIFSTKCGYTA
jgi:hypothetical protein